MRARTAFALGLLGIGTPAHGWAQLAAGADLFLSSRFVWHGLTRTTRPSLQGQVYAAYSAGSNLVAAGAGTNLEPFEARPGDLSDHRVGCNGIGEVDLWGEGAGRFTGGDVALGVATSFRRPDPNRPGPLGTFTTVEFYGRLRLTRLYLSPSLDARWDVDHVQGVYLEPAIHLPVLGNPEGAPFWAVYLSARAGINLGQGPDPSRATQHNYYAERGVTHIDLGAGVTVTPLLHLRGLEATLDAHLQFNRDALTQRVGLNRTAARALRISLVVSRPAYGGRAP